MTSQETSGVLRIGLVLRSSLLPAWQVELISRLRQSKNVEMLAVMLKPGKTGAHHHESALLSAYLRFERATAKVGLDACREMDASEVLTDVPSIEVALARRGSWFDLAEADVEQLKKESLDILLAPGPEILRGNILSAARHGVWLYRLGSGDENGIMEGASEVLSGSAVTESVLLRLGETPSDDVVVDRSFTSTDEFSVSKNRSKHFWKGIGIIERAIRDLSTISRGQARKSRHPASADRGMRQPRTNRRLALPLAAHLARHAGRKVYRRLFVDQWNILFRFEDEISTDLTKFTRIAPPTDRLWADPFVVCRDGRFWMFIEEKIYARRRAHLSIIEVSRDGTWTQPEKIIETPYHLSYPFVFEWEGDYYMMPETGKNRTVEIYRCERFPDTWELHTNLMEDIEAVDSTLFFHNSRWWLFASIVANTGAPVWDDLYLFSSDSPLSRDWTPHPMNPVVSDVRRARPAGKIFEQNGKLFRPSQDCSIRYGYGLRINEILVLTPDRYEERETAFVKPDWSENALAVHTLNHDAGLTVYDAIYRRSRLM